MQPIQIKPIYGTNTSDIVSLYHHSRNSNTYQELHDSRITAYNNNWITLFDASNYPTPVLKKTIGKKGKNFIYKTEKNNLLSIWYDLQTNVIEFWGDNYKNRITAMTQIQTNLNKNLQDYNKKQVNNY